MLRDDPPTLPATTSICLVGSTPDDVRDWSTRCKGSGWRVHTLLCEGRGAPSEAVTHLGDLKVPDVWQIDGPLAFTHIRKSDLVRWALSELHKKHRFNVVLFTDRHALAFRSIQAKRLGLDFENVALAAELCDTTRLRMHREEGWLARPNLLADEHAERYVVEHAEAVFVTDEKLLGHIREQGWKAGPHVHGLDVGALAKCVTVAGVCDPDSRPAGLTEAGYSRSRSSPLVTVAVAFYNLAAYLEETLDSLARQTYPTIEVIVLDDGSTDAEARIVFEAMREKYPGFRFVRQENQGIGATRNRGLELGQGKYFLAMDADNIARADMIERLVEGLERCPEVSALSCYFLAFRESSDLDEGRHLYGYRPTGGPHLLAALRNIYGDACSLFRCEVLRAIGGFTTDRRTSYEDWELFVCLVNAGYEVDVLPEYLLHYRHRDGGFSRQTNDYQNHLRVLRQYFTDDSVDGTALWTFVAGLQQRVDELEKLVAEKPRSWRTAIQRGLRRLRGTALRSPAASR